MPSSPIPTPSYGAKIDGGFFACFCKKGDSIFGPYERFVSTFSLV